jgi:hypothetical protein
MEVSERLLVWQNKLKDKQAGRLLADEVEYALELAKKCKTEEALTRLYELGKRSVHVRDNEGREVAEEFEDIIEDARKKIIEQISTC